MTLAFLLLFAAAPESFSDDYGLERRVVVAPAPVVAPPAPVAAPVVVAPAYQLDSSPCANGQCGTQRRGLFGRRR